MENYKVIINRSGESEDELMHYGVKGQKWGVRRYQNEDGTLTDAGKKRNARIGATLERRGNAYQKRANMALNKQQKLQSKRIDAWKISDDPSLIKMPEQEGILFDKYVANRKMADKMYEIRSTAIKDLSAEQIQKGRRYINASPAIGYILAGPIGAGVAVGTNESQASKYIKEYEQSH